MSNYLAFILELTVPVSSSQFRQVLSRFATGVTIVTVKNQQGVHGLTVNAFTSVSLEPPLILICIQKTGVSHDALSESKHFVVNILSSQQKNLADRFANANLSSSERFQNLSYQLNAQGIPILSGTLGHLECRVVNELDGGDHSIFLSEVEQAEVSEVKEPLIFYNSQYFQAGVEHDSTESSK
jgi:flavin reductase (DIM6/NTAB) family NADH-FMN oxidoreductase RutF